MNMLPPVCPALAKPATRRAVLQWARDMKAQTGAYPIVKLGGRDVRLKYVCTDGSLWTFEPDAKPDPYANDPYTPTSAEARAIMRAAGIA